MNDYFILHSIFSYFIWSYNQPKLIFMNLKLDYPVLSVAPGRNSHEILIGGGSGSEKDGIFNYITYCEIDSSGKLVITKKDEYDDKITYITTCFYESKTYISFINNQKIIVLNNKNDQKHEIDNKKRITSLSISSDLLIYTDDQFQLYLYNFPQLKKIYSCPKNVFKRAIFMKENNNTYILCISESKVKLLDPSKKFNVIAESKHFDFELKDLLVVENDIFILIVKERKQSFLIKMRHEANTLKTLKKVSFAHDAFCSMCSTSKLILLGNSFGDLIILDRFSLRKKKAFIHVHDLSITSICTVNDFIITGSLDYNVCVTHFVDKSNRKYNMMFAILLIFLCFFISYFSHTF